MTLLDLFFATSVATGLLLLGVAAAAPRIWYGWSSVHQRLLGRWRVGVGISGAAVLFGSLISLLLIWPAS